MKRTGKEFSEPRTPAAAGATRRFRVSLHCPTPLAVNPLEPDLRAVMEREAVRDRIMRKWPSHREAIRAFQEKREPQFNREAK